MDAAVPAPDPEDLRDDLVQDVVQLRADLAMIGLDLPHIPDFLKRTAKLELDAQIQKLRMQIEKMTTMKDRNAPSNSTSALVSTLAPSSAAVQKRGRVTNSSTIVPASPKAKRTQTFSEAASEASMLPIRQHGQYKCLSNIQAQKYSELKNMAEFVFGRLILEPGVRAWKRVTNKWYRTLPFPVGMDSFDYFNLNQAFKNGYLSSKNLLEAAQSNKQEWIMIGTNRPSRANNGSGAQPQPRSGDSGKTSQDSQPLAGNANIDTSKGAAHGARRGKTAQEDATWTPSGGAYAAPPPRPAADLRRCRVGAGGAAAADEEEAEGSDASEDDEAAGDAAGSAEE